MVLPKAESKYNKETSNRNPKSNVKPLPSCETWGKTKNKRWKKKLHLLLWNRPKTKEGKKSFSLRKVNQEREKEVPYEVEQRIERRWVSCVTKPYPTHTFTASSPSPTTKVASSLVSATLWDKGHPMLGWTVRKESKRIGKTSLIRVFKLEISI